MASKTIKISEENYRKLLAIASRLQIERNRIISFDEAIETMEIKKKESNDIMKFAGSWKLSNEEAETLIKDIYKERRIISRRL